MVNSVIVKSCQIVYNLFLVKQAMDEKKKNDMDNQIEAEKATAQEDEGDGEDQYQSFVPKKGKFMKEDIKLKKEMNEIMKGVLSES